MLKKQACTLRCVRSNEVAIREEILSRNRDFLSVSIYVMRARKNASKLEINWDVRNVEGRSGLPANECRQRQLKKRSSRETRSGQADTYKAFQTRPRAATPDITFQTGDAVANINYILLIINFIRFISGRVFCMCVRNPTSREGGWATGDTKMRTLNGSKVMGTEKCAGTNRSG